ncbi:uncharacterized protein BJ171DRAFT_598823 [Polychytrium aggregatum]|uniref:uncharacterized protein n=1 Tax=Polychytrium aggregatum TaxID=110093 RepID=UPI0022FE582E|nr:uncharacterized protein BJ171DRAFT_598823 [Polychytrium aggregatum]KAI9204792.1 hypothetical protein BJ171DRAFT_598823 [Polychytrium aggregatum]
MSSDSSASGTLPCGHFSVYNLGADSLELELFVTSGCIPSSLRFVIYLLSLFVFLAIFIFGIYKIRKRFQMAPGFAKQPGFPITCLSLGTCAFLIVIHVILLSGTALFLIPVLFGCVCVCAQMIGSLGLIMLVKLTEGTGNSVDSPKRTETRAQMMDELGKNMFRNVLATDILSQIVYMSLYIASASYYNRRELQVPLFVAGLIVSNLNLCFHVFTVRHFFQKFLSNFTPEELASGTSRLAKIAQKIRKSVDEVFQSSLLLLVVYFAVVAWALATLTSTEGMKWSSIFMNIFNLLCFPIVALKPLIVHTSPERKETAPTAVVVGPGQVGPGPTAKPKDKSAGSSSLSSDPVKPKQPTGDIAGSTGALSASGPVNPFTDSTLGRMKDPGLPDERGGLCPDASLRPDAVGKGSTPSGFDSSAPTVFSTDS